MVEPDPLTWTNLPVKIRTGVANERDEIAPALSSAAARWVSSVPTGSANENVFSLATRRS
jgi:hypothetical protein